MNEQSNMPVFSAAPEPFYRIWIRALTRPNEQTYADLAASPNAKANTAYLWYFVAALIQLFFASLVQGAVMKQMLNQFGDGQYGQFYGGGGIAQTLISAVCGAPVAAAISVLFFALGVAIIQWIAKMFSGRGNFGQLVYVMAAILSPFLLVSGVLTLLSAIPFVGLCFGLVSIFAGLYVLVLEVMAVKGVNQFGWGAAIGSVFIPGLVVFLFCICLAVLVIAVLMMMGPMIGNVFSGINQSLQNVP
jgi:hypothetical protein